MKKILLIVLIAILVGTGVYYYFGQTNGGWNNYSDSDFSIQYPKDFVVSVCEVNAKCSVTDGRLISFSSTQSRAIGSLKQFHDSFSVNIVKNGNTSLETILSRYDGQGPWITLQRNKLAINGIPVDEVSMQYRNSDIKTTQLIFQRNNAIYLITGTSDNPDYYSGKSFIKFYSSLKFND